MRSLLTFGLLTTSLLAGPSPDARDLNNYTYDGTQMGCMTRGLNTLKASNGVVLSPKGTAGVPNGMRITVNRPDVRTLFTQMNVSARACVSQLVRLIAPNENNDEPDIQTIDVEYPR